MKTSYPKEKVKILLLEGVHKRAIELFKESGYSDITSLSSTISEDELSERMKGVQVLGIRSKTKVTKKIIENADKLLTIGAFCIGTNNIDIQTATDAGIALFNSPFSNTRSVAELVIAETILLLRNVVDKNKAMHEGMWVKSSKGSFETRGKTIGIIGYGHIGSQVSVMAEGLGMNVIFYDVEPKLSLGNAKQVPNLETLLKHSDVVTLHAPGHVSTKHMINEDRLKLMKKGAILINCGRGDLIHPDAVKKALSEKHLGGLGIDVFASEPSTNNETFANPYLGFENVFLTPHIGGSTAEAQENIGIDGASKILKFLDTGSTVGSLSVPALSLPVQDDAHRILHFHKNVPGVLSDINSLLSEMKVNILAQYLKTNAKIGYVVLDIDKKTSATVMEALKQIPNTIRVRNLY